MIQSSYFRQLFDILPHYHTPNTHFYTHKLDFSCSTFGHLSRSALNNHASNRQFTTSELIGRRKKNGQHLFLKVLGNDLLQDRGRTSQGHMQRMSRGENAGKDHWNDQN